MRTLTLFAVALAGALSDVAVAEPPESAPLTVLSLESGKPTKEKILEFLNGGDVEWGGGRNGFFHFYADGGADYNSEANETASTICECEAPGGYSVAASSIEFRCRYECWVEFPTQSDGAELRRVRQPTELKAFLFRVLSVAPNGLMFLDQDDAIWLVQQCGKGPMRRCRASKPGRVFNYRSRDIFESIVVQLIPGTPDRTLFAAIEQRLVASASSSRNAAFFSKPRPSMSHIDVALVEGLPARTPRTFSEIYYVGGSQKKEAALALESAELVARQLEPVIGTVRVKRWPGAWPAQVVVVAGQAVAERAASGDKGGRR